MNIFIEARKSYEYLNSRYDAIVEYNLWEEGEKLNIANLNRHINNLRKLPGINPRGDTGPSTWFASIEKWEAMLEKLSYFASLKEEIPFRTANDVCERFEFNK